MVSLINFKIVNEDLMQNQDERVSRLNPHQQHKQVIINNTRDQSNRTDDNDDNNDKQQQGDRKLSNCIKIQDTLTPTPLSSSSQNNKRQLQQHQLQTLQASLEQTSTVHSTCNSNSKPSTNSTIQSNVVHQLHHEHRQLVACEYPGKTPESLMFAASLYEPANTFKVVWRNLSFAIKPKLSHRLANATREWFSSRAGHRKSQDEEVQDSGQLALDQPDSRIRKQSTISNNSNNNSNNNVDQQRKLVLDSLDGTFKSGELTAILGPSGAGKTTLLDCLTGHKRRGLNGSIKISSSLRANEATSEDQIHHNRNNANHRDHFSGDNLKVSIIPQNDHLIGHLSVYETLSYASKMKNCHAANGFDHKLNIKRVAQQLSLMSCLSTRINKLSGGQYKRVSIAQELLSSPDILILDEPTSGLDAMTCYQTVQVLRKLASDSHASGNKQIAVILTIHQPNGDVFQQFDHVYVVALGGKCIYEGPPSGIETAMKRVGIVMPSNAYNPATLIVEVAAGKFGSEAIDKLNCMQKKQYELSSLELSADEQNSTGDSAVDCHLSSSSFASSTSSSASTSSRDDDDVDRNELTNNNKGSSNDHDTIVMPSTGNDNSNCKGLINRGFVMDAQSHNNNNNNNIIMDAVVIVGSKDDPCDSQDADSIDKIKASKQANGANRKRPRKRSAAAKQSAESDCDDMTVGGKPKSLSHSAIVVKRHCRPPERAAATGSGGNGRQPTEKRLKLNSLKADQKFPFWRHTYLHFHRSWVSIVRDPMLCSMQLALHIIVPLLVSLVYGSRVGRPNACPRAGPVDIFEYANEPEDSALQLQEELRTTLENIGYIFFKLYGIIFAAMTVTVLTFPLDMHVLVKEFRNGWYGLSSYFIGRTLADVPFQLTLPLLAMSLSYYATGQPYSYMQWRFMSITGILILSSLIAQSQGLLFGAILMDRMKAAVFVAPAATTPIILFAGFLVRTQSIPRYLRPLSNLSYLRYAIEACLISRYGFNQCECEPEIFNRTVPEPPPIAKFMLDQWLVNHPTTGSDDNSTTDGLLASSNATAGGHNRPDIFNKLLDSLAKANSFGRNITSCDQVVPYPMMDFDLKDSQLFNCFAILFAMLIFTRLLTFFIVCFKVKRKV